MPSIQGEQLLDKISSWVSDQADQADKLLRGGDDDWTRGRLIAFIETEKFIKQATAEDSSAVEPESHS